MTLDFIYEDEWCVVVNKPNNVLVHHSRYARNIKDDSLVQVLRNQFNQSYYPIHRLDRKTSGVILLAKDKIHVNTFQKLFTDNAIEKKYIALLRGHLTSVSEINSPVRNAAGSYVPASSRFTPKKHFTLDIPVKPYPTSRYTLAELSPKTGRMHQLRRHANKISHPIVGDHKYGNRHHNFMWESHLNLPNLFLHAKLLKFSHPFNKKDVVIEAPFPPFWDELNDVFKKYGI